MQQKREREEAKVGEINILGQYFCPISFVMKIFFFISKQIFSTPTYFTKANISQAKAEGKTGEKVTYRREWTSGGGKPEL